MTIQFARGNTMKKTLFAASIVALLSAGGCATGQYSANNYAGAQSMGAMQVQSGVVESVRNVKIKPQNTAVGETAGAGAGALVGSNAGAGPRSGLAGMLIGAVVGGIAGHVAEDRINTQDGLEITVKLDKTGDEIAVTQGADIQFAVGDHVRVLTNPGTGNTRVTK